MAKAPNDIAALSFEKALAELEDIVQKLESGGVALEDSIALYERGAALKAHCEAKLKSAQEKIEKIVVSDAGGGSRCEGVVAEVGCDLMQGFYFGHPEVDLAMTRLFGMTKTARVPAPGAESSRNSALCAAAIACTSGRPRPRPSFERLSDISIWAKG